MSGWPPRDWRMMLALGLLAGGGLACTGLAGFALWSLANGTWPEAVAPERIKWLGWLGTGALALIGIVLTSYGFVLGRRAWTVKAAGMFDASASGGEDEPPAPSTSSAPAAAS